MISGKFQDMAERMTPDKGSPELRLTKLSRQRARSPSKSCTCRRYGRDGQRFCRSPRLKPLSHPRVCRAFPSPWRTLVRVELEQAGKFAGPFETCLVQRTLPNSARSRGPSSLPARSSHRPSREQCTSCSCACTVSDVRLATSSRRDMSWTWPYHFRAQQASCERR